MSQKLENLLNLALDADQGERERSEELDVGYDKEENVWELIVKYSGTLEAVRQTARSVTELLNGYAVIVIEEERIGQLAQLPEVEFIEKPKKLYFQTDVGRQVSCIDIVQDMPLSLRGKGASNWGSSKDTFTLAGHSLGHWMSAAAVLYRDTGNEEVLTKLNYAVTKLDELQKTSNSPYIGGCSEDCFTKLFSGFKIES